MIDDYDLRLVEDELAPGARIAVPALAGFRVTYVAEGRAEVAPAGGAGREELEENTARFGAEACAVKAGAGGATLWRWEMVRGDGGRRAEGEEASCLLKASHDLELDPGQEWMMRCDRVDFPPGGIAYTHVHSGPGLRCLLRGELTVRVEDGQEWMVRPGETWFERGPDPIYARASDEPTSFVRAMVVPRAYKGRTTITYVKAEDADKPKPQQYTRFVDEFIDP
ncbi:MAG: hypothetical protein OXG13_21435 [Gemmatimonadaceae bacterium]|nr:hypothetical protein [Gemmatimonadaceae bacterium]